MKQVSRALLMLACALLCGSVCRAQQLNCPARNGADVNQTPNGSQLCVKLKYGEGRVIFDRARSKFSPSDEFTRRLSITPAQAEELVFAQLGNVMAGLQKPYRFALTDEERSLDDRGQLGDAVVPAAVRAFSGEWLDYIGPFNEWAGDNRIHLEEIINNEAALDPSAGLLAPLGVAHVATALLVYIDGSYDAEAGTISFSVIDPINDWADASQADIQLLGVTDQSKVTSRLKQLRGRLKQLAGRPRCPDCITKSLQAFYSDLGLKPDIRIDNRNSSPLRITIIESPHIVGVSWASLDDKDKNVDKILYSLLTDGAFRTSLRKKSRIKSPDCDKAQIRADKQFEYQKCTGSPGPYLNLMRLQVQQLLVNQLGYTVSFVPAPGDPNSSNYFLIVQKTETIGEAVNETPESAPALANEDGIVESHEQEKEHKTEFAPETKKKGDEIKDKKNFLGGGGEYRPGQGVRFFGLGQLSRLPLLPDGVSSLSATAGAQASDGALGSLNYFADYVFFNSLGHRRLSVQLNVSSDLDADRELTAGSTDERRRSGVGRVELELFRDRGGSLLRFYAEGRRETVGLRPVDAPALTARQNQTTLDFGALYIFESQEAENPRWARFEPRLRMGLGLASGEPRFNKWGATGNLHQKLPRRFELDFSGRLESASRSTPVFELPSFGGADVVRGFRSDDALGRKLWSLQNELWIPLPISSGEGEGLKSLLRQSVKLAPFADVGGVYDVLRTKPGTRVGLGLGLRFIYNPVVFKFDYAYGFGPAATGGSRGKFHFGVVTNLPF